MRWILPLVLAGGLFGAAYLAVFSVPPESQAVITRGGVVDRVVGPGLQAQVPLIEERHIYPVLWEERVPLRRDFIVDRCPAAVALIVRVSDVVVFHEAGGDYGAVHGLGDRVAEFLAAEPDDAEVALRDGLADARPGGLQVVRAEVELGDCGPQAPRIVIAQQALSPIVTSGALGTERTGAIFERVRTADGAELEIDGAVGSFTIANPARFEACFGRIETARSRLGRLAAHAIRAGAQETDVAEHGDIGAAVSGAMAQISGSVVECGVAMGAVDFSAAQVTQVTSVDCDATPSEAACATPPELPRMLQP